MSDSRALSKAVLYWQLMRFHRPIGIWLLLWPTLWALWRASDGAPAPKVFAVFVLGTALTRAAGCIINDFADRGFDAHVQRTRERPLASGAVSVREAVLLFVTTLALALALVLWLGNRQVLLLSVPAVAIAAVYPFTKRFLSMPQAVLGLAFSWGIPMAYAAVQPPLPAQVPWGEVLLLMAANFCWVVAYDTFYAMSDRPDDLKIGVRSSAILFGRQDRLITAVLQAASLGLLAWWGRDLGIGYALGLLAAAGFSVREQWMIRERDRERCFQAFLDNNRFGMAVFLGIALHYLLR